MKLTDLMCVLIPCLASLIWFPTPPLPIFLTHPSFFSQISNKKKMAARWRCSAEGWLWVWEAQWDPRNGSIDISVWGLVVGLDGGDTFPLGEFWKKMEDWKLESRFGRVGEGELFFWNMFFFGGTFRVRCFVWHPLDFCLSLLDVLCYVIFVPFCWPTKRVSDITWSRNSILTGPQAATTWVTR